jgi:hypothetical protein
MNNCYCIEFQINDIYLNNCNDIANKLNMSFEKYVYLNKQFNSHIMPIWLDNGLYNQICFYKKSDCQNFINFLINNYNNEIINFLTLYKLIL